MRAAPDHTQSPQASASTNSATRAGDVVVDGISQEITAESSDHDGSDVYTRHDISTENPHTKSGCTDSIRSAANSTQTGALRELRVAADLMERGCQVFRNMAPSGIDLVVYAEGKLYKVEVATGQRRADGSIAVPNKPRHYEFDIIAVVLVDGTIAYFQH